MRQVFHSKTERRNRSFLCIVCIGIAAVVLWGIYQYRTKNQTYRPPDFENAAQKGEPEPAENYLYDLVPNTFDYNFAMAANLYVQEDDSINIYFTNDKDNKVNLLVKVVDVANQEILYESGVLKPGYYVEALEPAGDIVENTTEVEVQVYSFAQDTWQSEGTTRFQLRLQPK